MAGSRPKSSLGGIASVTTPSKSTTTPASSTAGSGSRRGVAHAKTATRSAHVGAMRSCNEPPAGRATEPPARKVADGNRRGRYRAPGRSLVLELLGLGLPTLRPHALFVECHGGALLPGTLAGATPVRGALLGEAGVVVPAVR